VDELCLGFERVDEQGGGDTRSSVLARSAGRGGSDRFEHVHDHVVGRNRARGGHADEGIEAGVLEDPVAHGGFGILVVRVAGHDCAALAPGEVDELLVLGEPDLEGFPVEFLVGREHDHVSPGQRDLGTDEDLESALTQRCNEAGIGQPSEIHEADAVEHYVAQGIEELAGICVHHGQVEINQHVSPPMRNRAAN
jgi:hypothetical protein